MPKDLKQVGKKHVDKLHSIKCQSKKIEKGFNNNVLLSDDPLY